MRVEYPSVTEPAGAAESFPAVTQPVAEPSSAATQPVAEPSSVVTQPMPLVTGERCAQCSAPLAHDQRYCLQCGEPRPHLTGPPSTVKPTGEAASSRPRTPPGATPTSSTPTRNNSLALLAGIGVLLLAMGVGVLIGRAGAGTAKAPPAQVISLGAAAGAGTATSSPTATTPSETPAAAKAKEAKAAESKAKEAKGSGNSISKPAPPTVLKSANSHESRQSFEQKSKSLPNVVSTG
jgi:hypothetical protein